MVTDGHPRGPRRTRSSPPTATEHEVDTIIFGTGFHVTDIPIARRGARPRRAHAGRGLGRQPEAYKGTAVAGFPNLFFLVGPNTGLGHNSIVFMIESQIDYVVDALRDDAPPRRPRGRGAARGAGRLQRRGPGQMTEGTVWVTGGCASWYLDRNGRNSTLWPTFTWPFRQRTPRVRRGRLRAGHAGVAAGPGRRVAAQRVLDPRRAAGLDPDDRARPVGAALAHAADERGLEVPAAGVPEPRARERAPLGLVVAGQRPRPVGVAEQDVLGAGRERVSATRPIGEQARPAQLGAGQLGLKGPIPSRLSAATAAGIVTRPISSRASRPSPVAVAPDRARQRRAARERGPVAPCASPAWNP